MQSHKICLLSINPGKDKCVILPNYKCTSSVVRAFGVAPDDDAKCCTASCCSLVHEFVDVCQYQLCLPEGDC